MRFIYILLSLMVLNNCATASFNIPRDVMQINEKYNEIEYVPDDPNLGYDDWKQPARFVEEGGDCEDFAIAKYSKLKESHDVAILLGIATFPGDTPGYHAVLLVDKHWILDNNFNEIIPLVEYIQIFNFKIFEIVDNNRITKLTFSVPK